MFYAEITVACEWYYVTEYTKSHGRVMSRVWHFYGIIVMWVGKEIKIGTNSTEQL